MQYFLRFTLIYIAVMVTFTSYDVMKIPITPSQVQPVPEICYVWHIPASKTSSKHTLTVRANATSRELYRKHIRTVGLQDEVIICGGKHDH